MPQPTAALALAFVTQRLSTFDLALVAVYLLGITLFGLRFREKKGAGKADKSLKSYFLANNTIPWWAIALSIVSAETSTLTIISIPGVAFAGDFGFLQVVIGYMLGRIVVAVLFLPRYFAGDMLTAYQLIDQRFGPSLHKVTAGLFLLTRAAAEGVRVFAVSIVVGIAIGTGDRLSIGIICLLTLLYTFEGGMAAVIWTDVVQMAIYVGGTVVALWSLGHHVQGGWFEPNTGILPYASHLGKLHVFNFARNLTQSYTFWAGVLGGTFLTMASHGTDQLMVQRMLAARNLRESRLALLSSGIVIFLQFSFFLLIGVGLFVFYMRPDTENMGRVVTNAQWLHGLSTDRIFPTFIVNEMPVGIAGLLVAAILAAAMSNLSAALNSLSSTTVVDFYMHLRPNADDRERAIISKSSTLFWALVLFAIAVATVSVGGKGHVVEIALSIASVAYGCLLGVFLLGTLTKFATEVGTSIGMITGFFLNVWLWQGTFPKTIIWKPGFDAARIGPNGQIVHDAVVPWITIPHIAFTWFVLIGALVTFAIGVLASLIFRKQSRRTHIAPYVASLLVLSLLTFPKGIFVSQAEAQTPGGPSFALSAKGGVSGEARPSSSMQSSAPDFTAVSTLINDAIAAHKLPGVVVVVGHGGKVVFHQAYGNRKLAGEPGLNGLPSPAEPMTEDTIFDMASLTKCLATATAVMQLYEQGKIASFDDPVEKYLPEFNNPAEAERQHRGQYPPWVRADLRNKTPLPAGLASTPDPVRSKVTVRMLLTHFSGEPPDVSLKDPWGLAHPERSEGFFRAETAALASPPGTKFVYSDINFILLGAIIERITGWPEDIYAAVHIYNPLQMKETRYLAFEKACGFSKDIPIPLRNEVLDMMAKSDPNVEVDCDNVSWTVRAYRERAAPTAHDDESKANPALNTDFDHLLRAVVHDPTTRRMGGVAGHAGVFSTAHDVSLYAQALLDKLLHNTGPFPLKQSTLQLMTQPEQPGHTTTSGAPGLDSQTWVTPQTIAANKATQASIAAGEKGTEPGLGPHYPAVKDQNLRGYGWDIDTAFSKPRGMVFPIGSFGHTGFTGTTLWMDPASDTYVVLLANAIHPRGGAPISNLRGEVATAVAKSLELYHCGLAADTCDEVQANPIEVKTAPANSNAHVKSTTRVFTGIDVLESTNFAALTSFHSFALLTNQTGIDAHGKRTIDILARAPGLHITTLFTPEHGITGAMDREGITSTKDPATGLTAISLYGAKLADRHPTHEQLKDLDAVVIDLQDAGVHYWTYEAAAGYFLEAAAAEKSQYRHDLQIIVLDRPNPVGGIATQGPVSDPGRESYTNYMPLPSRHGLTLGELLRYANAAKHLDAHLTVIPTQYWQRSQYFADTGLPWVNPSPNLRSPEAAILYPALGLIETTNISVGRGTATPFMQFGAPWMKGTDVASTLTARHIPGVTFTAITQPIDEDSNHYPFHGQTIDAVHLTVTDHAALDTPELAMEILTVLHRLYPADFKLERAMRLVDNQATMNALIRGDDPRDIAASWKPLLDKFRADTAPYLLYR